MISNRYKNIYVEISERYSGKTYRLCQDIINYITKTDESVYVLTKNRETLYLIKNICLGIINKNNLNIDINKIYYATHMNTLNNNERVYVDEFAYIENLDDIIFLRDNMYFTSSINENNNSELYKILFNFNHWRRKKIIDKLIYEKEKN